MSLATGPAGDAGQFYELIRELPWEEHVAPEGSIAIDIVGDAPAWVRRTTFAAQKAKDAIVDRFRERDGARPSVDFDDPDLRVTVRFGRDLAAIGIDLAGAPLHQRGYRQSAVEAPIKENLAAALLLRCGWPGIAEAGGAFVDPMCGSGTLVIEAALIAGRIAPGLLRRRFGFERWRQHDGELWARLRADALAARTLDVLEPGRLRGFDRDQSAIRASLANANRAGLAECLVFERRELAQLPAATAATGLALVNPPTAHGWAMKASSNQSMRSSAGPCCKAIRVGKRVSSPAIRVSAWRSACVPSGATRFSTARSRVACCVSGSTRTQ